jgi:S1-C subfamily serine protease
VKLLVLFAIWIAAIEPLAGFAQQPRAAGGDAGSTVAQLEKSLVDVIARAEPSVVAIGRTPAKKQAVNDLGIDATFGDLRGSASKTSASSTVGAGVIIDRAGFVLTQYLAVREGDQHTITTIDRIAYPAVIRAADPRSGLAVLAIDSKSGPVKPGGKPAPSALPGSFPAIRIGDAATLRKGQFVVAIGNPYAIQSDGQPTASWGIVTNLARKAPAGTNLNDAPGPSGDYRTTLHHLGTLIQTDAKLGFSAAGGALINLRGELIGLTTTASTIAGHERPAGYAIPMNATIRRIIDTLKQGREVEYGMLGAGFGPAVVQNPNTDDAPLTISQVYPGTPAARAGLTIGDVVTRIAGEPVRDVDDIQLAISGMPPGTLAGVEYVRNGRRATAKVQLAKLAVSGTKIATVRPAAWCGMRVDYATAFDPREFQQAVTSPAYDPQGCVFVSEVEVGSVAWRAGVRKGMFVSHVGGKRVATPAEFEAATRELGDKFDVRLTQPVEAEPKPGVAKP